ncbi:MAG: glycosyltransferase family 2 protein [Thermoleophilia bacterium]
MNAANKKNSSAPAGKVSVAIMTRNEEGTIADVIRAVMPHASETLVVDGHSTDSTREIAESLGARVLLDGGLGKGDGIRTAIGAASGDALVFIDADCSHDPSSIPALVRPILAGEADMVVGSRWTGGSDELGGDFGKFIRSTGSAIITLAINYRWGARLTDSQNGFRALSTEAARQVLLEENIFTIEQEMIMKFLKRGLRVSEVPTHEYCRREGDSQIVVWKVAHRYIWCLLKNMVK